MGVLYYALILRTVSAYDAGLGFDDWLEESATDLRGVALANEISASGGWKDYLEKNCKDE